MCRACIVDIYNECMHVYDIKGTHTFNGDILIYESTMEFSSAFSDVSDAIIYQLNIKLVENLVNFDTSSIECPQNV